MLRGQYSRGTAQLASQPPPSMNQQCRWWRSNHSQPPRASGAHVWTATMLNTQSPIECSPCVKMMKMWDGRSPGAISFLFSASLLPSAILLTLQALSPVAGAGCVCGQGWICPEIDSTGARVLLSGCLLPIVWRPCLFHRHPRAYTYLHKLHAHTIL